MNCQNLSFVDRQFCLGRAPNPRVILKGGRLTPFKTKIQTEPDDIFSLILA
jgi:hypothetical protein